MFGDRPRRVASWVLWTSLAGAAWLVASRASGFGVVQIAMFVGPGVVLAIAASWASHSAFPRDWSWRHGLRAATIGAGAFPPFVALFFAWAGTFGSTVMVTLLVYSAWLAILCGALMALVRLAVAPKHERPRPGLVVLTPERQSGRPSRPGRLSRRPDSKRRSAAELSEESWFPHQKHQ